VTLSAILTLWRYGYETPSAAEIEDQLKQVAETEHRSVQQMVLIAIEEYLAMRETAEVLADPAALRGLAEAREAEQAGDIAYGTEAARTLQAEHGTR
jgi:PHD/YefM family antitoxin component YafN of YafNO toxin-antitoxin module